MIHVLARETGTAESQQWFEQYAEQAGFTGNLAGSLLRYLSPAVTGERILDSDRCLNLFRQEENPAYWPEPAALLRLVSWKLQGTDGIRGKVKKAAGLGANLTPVAEFVKTGAVTPEFCSRYASAFAAMVRRFSEIDKKTNRQNDGTSRNILAFAEDGRDYFDQTGLKAAVIEALRNNGVNVVDLGVIPTPYLAAFSHRFGLPAIMLTASHNSAEYNGIKLFSAGRKLYPEGSYDSPGEYELSAEVLTQSRQTAPLSTADRNKQGKFLKIDITGDILAHLAEEIDWQILQRFLSESPVLLDTANGAYSYLAVQTLTENGISYAEAACNPGPEAINRYSGVGSLEDLPSVISGDQFNMEPLQYPHILHNLFRFGRSSQSPQLFAVVLDGDGDRGYILQFQKDQDQVRIYDGDDIGFLLAAVPDALKKNQSKGNRQLIIRATVESNAACLPSISEQRAALSLESISPELVCVGDRWLVSKKPPQHNELIGFERTGHVILPIKAPQFLKAEAELIKEFSRITTYQDLLYTGNGLLSAFAALQNIANSGLPIESLIFSHGMTVRKVLTEVAFERFYRDAPVWEEVNRIILSRIQENNWTCREEQFSDEPDMLFYKLSAADLPASGHLYLRKSGTEPKMTLCLAFSTAECGRCQEFADEIVQRITPLLL